MEIDGKWEPNFIEVFKGVIPDELCDFLINFFEDNDKLQHPGVVGQSEKNANIKMSTDMGLHNYMENKELTNFLSSLSEVLFNCLYDYIDMYSGFKDPYSYKESVKKDSRMKIFQELSKDLHILDFNAKRYGTEKNYYRWHYDQGHWSIRSMTRWLGAVCYFNSVEEGGETGFLYQNIKIKPEKGNIVLFPPFYTHVHCSFEPISNEKYVLSTWFQQDYHSLASESIEKEVDLIKRVVLYAVNKGYDVDKYLEQYISQFKDAGENRNLSENKKWLKSLEKLREDG